MLKKRTWTLVGAVALVGLLTELAGADTIALQSVQGGDFTSPGSTPMLFGWEFSVTSILKATELGVLDQYSDGLNAAHDVGIFRLSDGTLLTSANVPSGTSATLISGFRYVSLASPTTLTPDTYVIVMVAYSGIGSDPVIENSTGVVTASEVNYITSRMDDASTLAIPASRGYWTDGFFGPNFAFEPVPEPSTLVLLGIGAVGLLTYAWQWRLRVV
jgi:hypothetical protein